MADIQHPVQGSRHTERATTVLFTVLCVSLTSLALSAQEPEIKDPREFDVLAGQLVGADEAAQRQAADALKRANGWAVWQAVEKFPSSLSRDAALLDAVVRVLTDPEGDVCWRAAAAMALPALGGAARPARAELLRVAADRESPARVRGEAAESLAYLFPQDSAVVSAVVGMVEEGGRPGGTSAGPAGIDAEAARAGARVLAGLGERGEAALLDLLIAGTEPAAELAAWALREHGDPARSPLLEKVTWLLSGDVGASPALRQAVVNSLLGQGGARRSAINLLTSGLATGTAADRLLCVRASGTLGADARGAVPGLIRMLADGSAGFRLPVLASLGELGNLSAGAKPTLEKMLREARGYEQVPPAAALLRVDADHDAAGAVLTSFVTSAEEESDARQEVCGQIAQASASAALLAHGSPAAARLATGLDGLGPMIDARLILRLRNVLMSLGDEAIAELADACPVEGATGPAEVHAFIQAIKGLEARAAAAGETSATVDVISQAALLERALARGAPSFVHVPVAVALLQEDSGSAAAIMALLVPMLSGPGEADALGWYATSGRAAASMAREALATRPTRTVQQLIAALADPDVEERRLALAELGEMGPAAARAVPAIRAIIRHGGSAIAQRMILVLEKASPPSPDAVAMLLGTLTQQVSPVRMRELLLGMPRDGTGLDSGTREQLTRIVDEFAIDPRANHAWSKDLASMVILPPRARAALGTVRPAKSLSAAQVVQGLEQCEIEPLEGLEALLARGSQGRALLPEVLRTLLDRRPAGAPAADPAAPGTEGVGGRAVGLVLALMQAEKQRSGEQIRLLGEACPVTLGVLRSIGAPPSGPLPHLESFVTGSNLGAGGLALHAMAEIAPKDQRTTQALLALLKSTKPAEITLALDVASSTTIAGSSSQICQGIVDLVVGGRVDERQLYSAVLALEAAGAAAHGAAPRLFRTLRALACEPPATAGWRAERKGMLQACLRSIEAR